MVRLPCLQLAEFMVTDATGQPVSLQWFGRFFGSPGAAKRTVEGVAAATSADGEEKAVMAKRAPDEYGSVDLVALENGEDANKGADRKRKLNASKVSRAKEKPALDQAEREARRQAMQERKRVSDKERGERRRREKGKGAGAKSRAGVTSSEVGGATGGSGGTRAAVDASDEEMAKRELTREAGTARSGGSGPDGDDRSSGDAEADGSSDDDDDDIEHTYNWAQCDR